MKDFRNRVAHDYVNLNMFVICDVIMDKLPSILENLEDLVATEISNKNFILEEYQVCIRNRFYKHVKFDKINFKIR
ncbi:HepT-like ribonuclease domain-containing protein [Ilyobacter sp.]|uniref:HepT-like ribonuclease domain-containing protein n=1 Tax=Ilyobacter sp. TaxID=3100343 RepID=UPI00356452BB